MPSSDTSNAPVFRVVLSDLLDPAAAAVQCGHVAAVAAAGSGRHLDWASTTFVVHTTPSANLTARILDAGGCPARTGAAGGLVWFTEPDLLWEPTAVACCGGQPELASLALYTTTGRPP